MEGYMKLLIKNKKGFTLIEMVVVMVIVALFAATIIPSAILTSKTSRAKRDVAESMYYIANSCINFFEKSKDLLGSERWPANIDELIAYDFIPSSWSNSNPWGNPYTITNNNFYIAVATVVPKEVANGIKGKLKLSESIVSGDNATVTTNVPKPWSEFFPDCGWPDGTNYDGADLTLTDGRVITGRHKGIKTFTVPAGATAYVTTYDGISGGGLEVCAKNIVISGTLTASGSGYKGGCGGDGTSCPVSTPPFNHPGFDGNGPFFGTGGAGGNSCDRCNAGNGTIGSLGGYASSGINGDTSTDESLLIGSGAGGGGGGGASYGPNCTSYGLSSGGGGGAGGRGGGSIWLYGSVGLQVAGIVSASGTSLNGNGGGGQAVGVNTSCANPCQYIGAGGNNDLPGTSTGGSGGGIATGVGSGGNGGNGGGGAGGGILLKSPLVTVTGTVRSLGGNSNPINGGTLKIFYQGTAPGGTKQGGRVYETTY